MLKTNGILSFITSNSFLKAEYGAPLRKYLLKNSTLLEIINIEDTQIFGSR
jgi:type II restriction/modification system DNA methylase subunit YeeA